VSIVVGGEIIEERARAKRFLRQKEKWRHNRVRFLMIVVMSIVLYVAPFA